MARPGFNRAEGIGEKEDKPKRVGAIKAGAERVSIGFSDVTISRFNELRALGAL